MLAVLLPKWHQLAYPLLWTLLQEHKQAATQGKEAEENSRDRQLLVGGMKAGMSKSYRRHQKPMSIACCAGSARNLCCSHGAGTGLRGSLTFLHNVLEGGKEGAAGDCPAAR